MGSNGVYGGWECAFSAFHGVEVTGRKGGQGIFLLGDVQFVIFENIFRGAIKCYCTACLFQLLLERGAHRLDSLVDGLGVVGAFGLPSRRVKLSE
ncbi:Ku70 Ku80 beta-barrel domain-containing protein, putative [Babesia ovata]|uniref:Ku70 Ku80 beta-barrel domain-containing protein, putative n=1 Tax=Babesia ovata TaxID=189622 RepID=A0A2H6KJT6_9APIC|nr:Ku70 Ku80 beta-barrel domain-containing protein, putative [Babesia ovata]GBE63240.1 Ku70 Ku80 beta-barrel domain-containing protein, putative [Babesia ovata]